MNKPLVRIQGLSKKFPKNLRQSSKQGFAKTIKSLFGRSSEFTSVQGDEFMSLNNISFEIKRGDVIGLIGKNGAGKSTLLKHISGIHLPDAGSIEVSGHIEALIELGAGFHPLLSGKENIKQRVSLLGLSKPETEKILKQIIDFSELGDLINMPVKNYSSGMQARLGFASAVLTKPDILLVDEVLSVGDFEFRQKCLSKINEIKKDTAIIFVSHSHQTLRMFCMRGIVLEKGTMIYDGSIESALDFYQSSLKQDDLIKENEQAPDRSSVYGNEFINSKKIFSFEAEWVDKEFKPKTSFISQESVYLRVKVHFDLDQSINNLILAIPFWHDEVYVTSLSSDVINEKINIDKGIIDYVIKINPAFNEGIFFSCLAIHDGPEHLVRKFLPELKIINNHERSQGIFKLNYEFKNLKEFH